MAESNPAAINDMLQTVLDGLHACMSNTVDGPPASKFLSFNRPPDDCCDYLAIWLESIQATKEFPILDTSAAEGCGGGRMMTVAVKLVRSCWPVIQDNPRNPFPPGQVIQAAAEKLTVDANVVWCCLESGLSSGEFWIDGNDGCKSFRMIELRVDPARGACAGFTVRFQMELEGCCDG